jgi:hypothetical protein
MAELTVNSIVLNNTGTEITLGASPWESAASAGDYFANPATGRSFLMVDTSAQTCTVTVASATSCDQGGTHNIAMPMAANETRIIGNFTTNRFNDGNDRVQLTYSTVTDLKVCVISY